MLITKFSQIAVCTSITSVICVMCSSYSVYNPADRLSLRPSTNNYKVKWMLDSLVTLVFRIQFHLRPISNSAKMNTLIVQAYIINVI